MSVVSGLRELLWLLIEALLPLGVGATLLGVGAVVGVAAGVVHGLLEGASATAARRQVAAAALDIRLGIVEPGVLPRRSLTLAARSAVWMLWTVPAVAAGLPLVVLAMVELQGVAGVEAAAPLTVVALLDDQHRSAVVDVVPPPSLRVEQGTQRIFRFAGSPPSVALRVGDEVMALSPRVDGGVDGRSRGWGQALEPGRGRSLPAMSAFVDAHIVGSPVPSGRQPGGWPWEIPFLVGAVLAGFAGAWLGRRTRELVAGPTAVERQAER